ncbi:hypothetical protein HMPREF1624_07735 [Sporothrix schenckii ATCC 58251]|uniref:N-acetyltransferase B complex non catalytic subunit n=1 Tax=Sporothrix schenckii (strain ATCC 58251 / de Perez 2211183) TaxID=1391915 RepID=U7PL57_SPOS1|nr:hypothetical protein HMPREF1624_07735 [Sporothrix schenckii ATCC 58251]
MEQHTRQRPRLKNGVDMQLQAAFAEQNWTTVIRLADKRHKASKDPYYEVVKVCAETQVDGVVDKAAAAVLVDNWVRSGAVPKDLESIELLEWACDSDGDMSDYSTTFGVLHARWVKANPRNVAAATASLRACLQAWDLANAQQIATILDKSSHTHDRRYMFWGILLTHLLAGDVAQAESKRKIYGMLAQKQLEKAAEAAEAAASTAKIIDNKNKVSEADRSLHTEEEFLLYLRVVATHGTADNYTQRALHKTAGAAAQLLAAGRKQLFDEVLEQLETLKRWDSVFDLCRQALSMSTGDNNDQPSTVACDVRVWNSFIAAAQKSDNPEAAFDTVQSLLFITARSPKLPQMYTKNVGLALLQTTFGLPPALLPEPAAGQSSLQVEQLLTFIEANLDKVSLFDDIRLFTERLSFAQAQDLINRLTDTTPSTTLRKVLVFKLRYLLTTCPETRCPRSVLYNQTEADADAALLRGDGGLRLFELACKVCRNAAPASYGCTHCLQELVIGSLQLHRTLSDDADFIAAVPKMDKDPRIDLALVAGSSLLRLAGDVGADKGVDTSSLLQAALVLDAQQRQTPDDITLRLLLIRVFLRLGCGSHAHQLWQPLGVKRSILDALGPLFYDRLSTVAPGLFTGSSTPKKPLLMDPLKQYFSTVLRHPSAVRIWDAFAAGSYSSILDMAAYHGQLQRSCTRVMTVVEERRAARALGGRLDDGLLDDLASDLARDDAPLHNSTDYGALPNLESSFGAPLAEKVSLGPGLSDMRMQLSLLAERYLEVISFKPAKEYKPAKAAEAAARDKVYLLESLARIQFSLDDLLHASAQPAAHLTAGEWAYYTAVSVLVSFATFSLGNTTGDATATAPPIFSLLTESLTTAVDLLRKSALPPTPSSPTTSALLRTFTDIHSLGMLRETAVAVKHTGAFLGAFHDKENARDRTGKSGLGKEALAGAAAFKTLSARLLADIKTHVKASKDTLGAPGWLDRLSETVSQPGDGEGEDELTKAVVVAVGGSAAVEDWAGHLLDGWRETIRGLGQVQLD